MSFLNSLFVILGGEMFDKQMDLEDRLSELEEEDLEDFDNDDDLDEEILEEN